MEPISNLIPQFSQDEHVLFVKAYQLYPRDFTKLAKILNKSEEEIQKYTENFEPQSMEHTTVELDYQREEMDNCGGSLMYHEIGNSEQYNKWLLSQEFSETLPEAKMNLRNQLYEMRYQLQNFSADNDEPAKPNYAKISYFLAQLFASDSRGFQGAWRDLTHLEKEVVQLLTWNMNLGLDVLSQHTEHYDKILKGLK